MSSFALWFQEALQKELIGGDVNDRPLSDFVSFIKQDSKDDLKLNRDLNLLQFCREIQKLVLKSTLM